MRIGKVIFGNNDKRVNKYIHTYVWVSEGETGGMKKGIILWKKIEKNY